SASRLRSRRPTIMSRYGLILLGLMLSTGTSAAQESEVVATGIELPPRVFTPAQERAASEARARQARMRTRRDAGVSLVRPTFHGHRALLDDPRLYRIDPGIARQTVHAPWLR
ncbi:MAG TPA: hypothetical protein VM165_23230, partial [Planctomycetaceae bacterium]|nr:hypothetical protein [Planctomycetaceae bacterium]